MKYSFDSKVRYSEGDSNSTLTIPALINYFQDCSVFHSQSIGLGMDYLNEHDMAWMISSWHICIDRLPQVHEEIKTSTWAYDMKAFYGYRNFDMKTDDEKVCAYAQSIWVLIDTKTGRPTKISQEMTETYQLEAKLDMPETSRKITIPKDLHEAGKLVVPQFFIDTNNHMNNEKYILVAQQYLPSDFVIKELRVEYRKQAKLGDTINVMTCRQEDLFTVVLADEETKPYAVIEFKEYGA